MGKVKAVCDDLSNYGQFFETKATEFGQVTQKMENIIDSLKGGWTGADAENFIANATAYLQNLKIVESQMAMYGSTVKRKATGYNNACASFYEILNG